MICHELSNPPVIDFLKMDLIAKHELWIDSDGELEFSCTKVIYKIDEDIFYAFSQHREKLLEILNYQMLKGTKIPKEDIYPEYTDEFTKAPDPFSPNC